MNNSDLLYAVYEPDPRYVRLVERYHEYCSTSEYLDNLSARALYKEFKDWCVLHGYTQDDINYVRRAHPYRFSDEIGCYR
jgi:hypothetical protein